MQVCGSPGRCGHRCLLMAKRCSPLQLAGTAIVSLVCVRGCMHKSYLEKNAYTMLSLYYLMCMWQHLQSANVFLARKAPAAACRFA